MSESCKNCGSPEFTAEVGMTLKCAYCRTPLGDPRWRGDGPPNDGYEYLETTCLLDAERTFVRGRFVGQ